MTEEVSWTHHGRNEELLHRVKEERNVLYTIKRRKEGRINGMVTSSVGTAFIEGKLEGKNEIWKEGEEGDVSSYWMTLRKRKDNGN
jgi:hypothetical protein